MKSLSSVWIATLMWSCVPTEVEEEEPPPEIEIVRLPLHELFTGSNCGPCLEADEKLLAVLYDNPGEYTLVSHQIGSDPYITGEGVARRMYYLPEDAGSYSIPYLHVDGVNELHPHLANEEAGYLQEEFDLFASQPSSMGLEVSHTLSGQTLSISTTLQATGDYPSEDLRLRVAIVEKLTTLNVGSNGQTEFHQVMKKMVPDEHGTAIPPLVKGDELSFDFSYTFQGEYDPETGIHSQVDHEQAHTVEEFEDLAVVVFVQDDATWRVHQSAESD
ncbi:MAG: hypothetical protein VX519_08710 [Myxococcota bacterium]|nr:hypothetical protein [Myxococcota bacterium]